MIFICSHGSLVNTSFGLLSVSHDNIGLPRGLIHLRGYCHTYTYGETMTESTRVNLYPSNAIVGMPTEMSMKLAILRQIFLGDKPFVGQHHIKGFRTVAFTVN